MSKVLRYRLSEIDNHQFCRRRRPPTGLFPTIQTLNPISHFASTNEPLVQIRTLHLFNIVIPAHQRFECVWPPMSKDLPLNGESYSSVQLPSNRASPPLIRKPSLSQFPVPPGAPPWHDNPASPTQIGPPLPHPPLHRRRAMNDPNGTAVNGRISPYTLSVAAEFSLKRANRQLMVMGETLESVKSELSPTSAVTPAPFRLHSRSSSEPNTPVTTLLPKSADGYSRSGDMLGDMRRLAVELRTLRESIDPARRGSASSIASTSRGSTPLTSPRTLSRGRDNSVETPRTSPRHSRQSSRSGLQTLREEQPVIEVQTIRGSAVGQPAAVVRIFRSTQGQKLAPPRTHGRSVSDSHGISIRQYDYSGREIYSSPRLRDESYTSQWRHEERPESEQSMVSDRSYHTALQDSYVSLPDVLNGHTSDQASDHISDTATIGRPDTPVTEVRSIGINTEDVTPPVAIVSSSPTLQKKPSRAALLSNIRGCQDGIIIARLHSAVDKLAVQLASNSSQNSPDDATNRQKLQAALDLLEKD